MVMRFIPAGAGNTFPHYAGFVTESVHPRGRGEHGGDLVFSMLYAGSSPRARGTLSSWMRGYDHPRFIPAGAGNTAPGA